MRGTAAEVQAPDRTAARVNEEHRAFRKSARDALEHMGEVGRLLREQKGNLPHGAWLPWVRDHLEFGEREAERYMLAYKHREEIRHAVSDLNTTITSLSQALRLVAETREVVLQVRPSAEP